MTQKQDSGVKLLFIRHCESIANANGLLGGLTDYDLSEEGRRQAEVLSERLQNLLIDAIYSSPLKRAYNTIEPYAKAAGKPINVEYDLREVYVGTWEDTSWDSLFEQFPEQAKKAQAADFFDSVHGAEPMENAGERMFRAAKKIAEENIGKMVVLCTHTLALRAFLCKGLKAAYNKSKELVDFIPNANVMEVYYLHGKFNVVRFIS